MLWFGFLILIVLAGGAVLLGWRIRQRHMHIWLGAWLRQAAERRPPRADEEIHVLLCFADHWEPKGGGATAEQAAARVQRWVTEYPALFGRFRDSDGRTPRHTFFYPIEEYQPEYLDALAELCRRGFGEVEVHLHHDGDTAANLRSTLVNFKELLAERHGLLARDRDTWELRYGFVHGNWALDNSRPDGRCCGVANELSILRETGCYADFTLPSAPSPTQTRKINSIYYARGTPGRCKGHDTGIDAGREKLAADALMLIQGPLLLDWRDRRLGVLPRTENACLQASQPPTLERLALWLRARVQVPTRPDWFFVKLHMHGTQEVDQSTLLGEPLVRFHEQLAELARTNSCFHFHYVTAREMFNLARAAETGWTGSVQDALDYQLVWNGTRCASVPERVLDFTAAE